MYFKPLLLLAHSLTESQFMLEELIGAMVAHFTFMSAEMLTVMHYAADIGGSCYDIVKTLKIKSSVSHFSHQYPVFVESLKDTLFGRNKLDMLKDFVDIFSRDQRDKQKWYLAIASVYRLVDQEIYQYFSNMAQVLFQSQNEIHKIFCA